jgi:colicin import membrane protein/protein TonB
MSSTNLDAPSPKLTLATIAVVVGLHVLTAVALAAVKTPEMKVEPEKVTPPIEIELITPPPPPPPVEVEEINLKEDPEPVREVKPKPKAKPVAAPKPKVVEKKQPVEKPKPAKFTPPPAPQKTAPQKSPDTKVADDQRRLLAAQAEQARRDALLAEQQTAQANAAAIAAQVKAAADAKKAQEIANAKAAADAQAKADARAKADAEAAAAAAASNTPQPFSGSDASWIVAPDFTGISSKSQTLTIRFTVTKQGVIQGIDVRGKDRDAVREVKKRMGNSKIKPFIRGGVTVVGNVTMSVVVQ